MKTQMNEKWQEKSSLKKKGRFFLLLFSYLSFFQYLDAATINCHENEIIVESDSLKSFNNNVAKIYVTGGAQLSDVKNTINSPVIIIIKKSEKKQASLKKTKLKRKVVEKRKIKKNTQKQTYKFYYTNSQDKEFIFFSRGLDKAVVTTTHQIKLFLIDNFFILSIVLLWSLYLMPFFREKILFTQSTGQNFQRPPPYFSMQLF